MTGPSAAEVHNLLSPEELKARGFDDGEELLLPMPGSDSEDSDDAGWHGAGEPGAKCEAEQCGGPGHADGAPGPTGCCSSSPPPGPTIREDQDGPLGQQVFPCSRVLLRWLLCDARAPPVRGARVLELGAGTGALALGLVAAEGGAAFVCASEGDDSILANLEHNVAANSLEGSVHPLRWDWEERQLAPPEVDVASLDFVVAADVVYVGTAEAQLAMTLATLCRSTGRSGERLQALVLLADRPPGGLEFLPARQRDLAAGEDPDGDSAGESTAVGRFLAACGRQRLAVERLDLEPGFVQEALRVDSRSGRPDGELCLYRLTAPEVPT